VIKPNYIYKWRKLEDTCVYDGQVCRVFRAGSLQQAIDNLKALCDPWPVSTDEAKPDEMNDVPYFHTFPKQMQDALRQLRVEGKF